MAAPVKGVFTYPGLQAHSVGEYPGHYKVSPTWLAYEAHQLLYQVECQFHLAFMGEKDSLPSQDKQTNLTVAFTQSIRLAIPSGTTSCVSGPHIAICDFSIVNCGSCMNPNMLIHSKLRTAFKTKDTTPRSVNLRILFSKSSSGSEC